MSDSCHNVIIVLKKCGVTVFVVVVVVLFVFLHKFFWDVHKPGLMYFLHLVLHQKDPQIKLGPEWEETSVSHITNTKLNVSVD